MWTVLAAVASAVISGIVTFTTQQSSQNQQSKYLQQQYEYESELQGEEEAYNERMMQEEMEYNSAVNQRARLEQAGMNPYMMMSGGSAGTVSAASTGMGSVGLPQDNSAAQGAAAGNQITSSMDTIIKALQTQLQGKVQNEQAEGMAIDNKYKEAMNMADIAGQIAEMQLKIKQAKTEEERAKYTGQLSVLTALQSDEKEIQLASPTYVDAMLKAGQEANELKEAQTNNYMALTQQIRELLPYQKALSSAERFSKLSQAEQYQIQSKILDCQATIWQNANYQKAMIEQAVATGAMTKAQAKIATSTIDQQIEYWNQNVELSMKNNNWYWFNNGAKGLMNIGIGLSSTIGAFKGLPMFGASAAGGAAGSQ